MGDKVIKKKKKNKILGKEKGDNCDINCEIWSTILDFWDLLNEKKNGIINRKILELCLETSSHLNIIVILAIALW